MHEFIIANLLFHVAAGTTLMLLAAGSAALELNRRRSISTPGATVHDTHTVIELPVVPRAPKLAPRVDLEEQSEAA
ncbi:MAG: hypothetical protein IPH71_05625 [Proteobacteria bacterium]|jgi:hypothetical protein|nr:hypothetical protein [Pseudomonadota bacterium]MCC6630646.1 hypothetical protein [Gammaproteobacteria bacterium]